MQIRRDDLSDPRVHALLREHLDDMHRWSPPESIHALDLDRLRAPDIAFWTLWDEHALLGCAALRELDPRHGEIKSMRTARAHRGRGVARALLEHLVDEALRRGYGRLSLETGSMPEFGPARALYESAGFQACAPFGDYRPDPNSVFMSRELDPVEAVHGCSAPAPAARTAPA